MSVTYEASTRSYTTSRMFDNSGDSGPPLGVPSFGPVVSPLYICDTSGVATDQICTGPRLRLTVLMMYTPLCVIGASRIATPDELFTVCTTVPEGLINTNSIGTATLGSAAIEIACVPVGSVMLLSSVCPAD